MGSERRKPKVLTRCVANYHAATGERIVEVSSEAGGCLISLQERLAAYLQENS